MARGGKERVIPGPWYPSPFNETNPTGPETPDMANKDIYWNGWDEIKAHHLMTQSVLESPGSANCDDIYGKPAAGEPSVMQPPMPHQSDGKK